VGTFDPAYWAGSGCGSGRPKGRGKLDPHRGFFAEIIVQDADITMPELSAALVEATGVRAHPNAIGKFLRKLGYSFKKGVGRYRTPARTCKAAARRLGTAPHARNARSSGTACVYCFSGHCYAIPCQPEDETSVKTNLARQRGWSRRGDRMVMNAPFGAWGTQTLIAGLSADALIAPWVIKGAMDGPAFAAYIEKVLVPELVPGAVVILDNLATHKNFGAVKAM